MLTVPSDGNRQLVTKGGSDDDGVSRAYIVVQNCCPISADNNAACIHCPSKSSNACFACSETAQFKIDN